MAKTVYPLRRMPGVAGRVTSVVASGGQTIGPDGQVVGGGISITGGEKLRAAIADLRGSVAAERHILFTGDSLIQLGGDTTAQSSDTRAEQFGFAGQLTRALNARFGGLDGGQFIHPDAVASDTRVANAGTPVLVNDFAPISAWRNSGSTIVRRQAVALESAGQTITYTFNGRFLNVILWENAANTYNGNWTYSIDGGGAVTVNGVSATDTYRTERIDCLTDAPHTVVLARATNRILVVGAFVSRGTGIIDNRFGWGGSTTQDWLNAFERVRRVTWRHLPASLTVIRHSHNEALRQENPAYMSRPDVFRSNLRQLIDYALGNTSVKGILLINDPPTSTVFNPRRAEEYWQIMDEVSREYSTVAFADVSQLHSTYAVGNNSGMYVDNVHRSAAGFQFEADAIATRLAEIGRLSLV